MTRESAEKFIAKLKNDQTFANSLQNAKPVDRAKIISGAGFEFTNDELQKVIEVVSDEELAVVLGGQWKSGSNENRIPVKMNEAGEMRYPYKQN